MIHLSSVAVLEAPFRRPIGDNEKLKSNPRSYGPYVWGKLESEKLAQKLASDLDLDLRIVRPGPIVDFDDFDPPGRLGKRLGGVFVAIGPGRQRLGVVDVNFAARMLVWMATHPDETPAALNLLNPTSPTKRDLIGRLRHRNPGLRVVWLPRPVLHVLSWTAIAAQKILRPSRTAVNVAKVFSVQPYDTSAITRPRGSAGGLGIAAGGSSRVTGGLPDRGKRLGQLLFLSHILPFPLDEGGRIRTYHLLRLLSQWFDVTALCLVRNRSTNDIADASGHLSQLATLHLHRVDSDGATWKKLYDHARSVLQRKPYTAYTTESEAFRKDLSRLVRQRWEAVHVDSLDLSGYLPLLNALPVICGHHNVESSLLARRGRLRGSSPSAAYLRLQGGLRAREEAALCPRFAMNLCASDEDRTELNKLAPTARIAVVPNGVDADHFRPGPDLAGGIVFVGSSSWEPNADGMFWFVSSILPLIRATRPGVPVHWIGNLLPEHSRRIHRYGIHTHGRLIDIRPTLGSASCVIVPIRAGSGTRLKILDAWAMGRPVITTSIGCEGLRCRDGWNCLIGDTPEGFAQAVEQVLSDRAKASALGANGRATVEQYYSWSRVGELLQGAYDVALSHRRYYGTPT